MRQRLAILSLAVLVAHGCVSSRVRQPEGKTIGMASWYGEEFAGRTTANGEIFDPMRLTAAHRGLPFGTIVEVTNLKNGKNVQVRINDRGPFVGNRIIDLSYAAAQKLDMVQSGIGEVELKILKMGAGDREPPQPIVVSIEPPAEAPKIAFPLPSQVKSPAPEAPPPPQQPATTTTTDASPTVESVEVQVEKSGKVMRKQVGPDGRTIIEVPVENGGEVSPRDTAPSRPAGEAKTVAGFVLQFGAFSSVENAQRLAERLREFNSKVYVDQHGELHRVRVGPFKTREEAIEAREKFEANNISAIIVSE